MSLIWGESATIDPNVNTWGSVVVGSVVIGSVVVGSVVTGSVVAFPNVSVAKFNEFVKKFNKFAALVN